MRRANYRSGNGLLTLIVGLMALSGCGGGSTDSGGGFVVQPGDTIPYSTSTRITQSGTYVLPSEVFLTDIGISCPAANVDLVATNPNTGRIFSANCNAGSTTIFDFPSQGGTLEVNFNSGSETVVRVSSAISINMGNR